MSHITISSNDNIVGLRIKLERTIDGPCGDCGETVVIIGADTGPRGAALCCICCDRQRGWLPEVVANFLARSVALFGRSPEPILIHNSHFAAPRTGALAVEASSAP